MADLIAVKETAPIPPHIPDDHVLFTENDLQSKTIDNDLQFRYWMGKE